MKFYFSVFFWQFKNPSCIFSVDYFVLCVCLGCKFVNDHLCCCFLVVDNGTEVGWKVKNIKWWRNCFAALINGLIGRLCLCLCMFRLEFFREMSCGRITVCIFHCANLWSKCCSKSAFLAKKMIFLFSLSLSRKNDLWIFLFVCHTRFSIHIYFVQNVIFKKTYIDDNLCPFRLIVFIKNVGWLLFGWINW